MDTFGYTSEQDSLKPVDEKRDCLLLSDNHFFYFFPPILLIFLTFYFRCCLRLQLFLLLLLKRVNKKAKDCPIFFIFLTVSFFFFDSTSGFPLLHGHVFHFFPMFTTAVVRFPSICQLFPCRELKTPLERFIAFRFSYVFRGNFDSLPARSKKA